MAIQRLLRFPRGSINSLQARIVLVAAPVGGRASGQLERRNVFGGRGVRSAAQIPPDTFPGARIEVVVGGQLVATDLHHVRVAGFVVDQFEFVGLAGQLSAGLIFRLVYPPGEQLTILDDDLHALLELLEVLRRERLRYVEVVVETIGDRRADSQLRGREQLLHGLGQDVGGRMPDHTATLVGVGCHRCHLGVGLRRPTKVAQRAGAVTDHHDRGGFTPTGQAGVAHSGSRRGPGRNPEQAGRGGVCGRAHQWTLFLCLGTAMTSAPGRRRSSSCYPGL